MCNSACFSPRLEGLMDLYSQGYERSYTVNSSILNAIEPHLKDFQQLLLVPPKVKPQSREKSANLFQTYGHVVSSWLIWDSYSIQALGSCVWKQHCAFHIPSAEKCNIDDRWCSRAATGECPPSHGQAGGRPAADQCPQYLPGALQSCNHGPTTGRLKRALTLHIGAL